MGSTTTDGLGYYMFDYLLPSNGVNSEKYNVSFTPPSSYAITPSIAPGDNSNTTNNDASPIVGPGYGRTPSFDLSADEFDSTVDAGLYLPFPPTAFIGDYVWLDSNKDGLQSPGEKGISGVVVSLLDGQGNVVATTITNGSGYYAFTNVAPGNGYSVKFTPPVGYIPTIQTGTLPTGNNSDISPVTLKTIPFNVVGGDTLLYLDAGFIPQDTNKASLGDKVFYDVNGNGVQDSSEKGVGNVTVNLLNATGTTVIATTTTDKFGNYVFNNLPADAYKVQFDLTTLPLGATVSPKNVGNNVGIDSDPDPVTGITDVIYLGPGDKNMTVDAGIKIPANNNSIGDYVWFDANKDGIQDATEIPMPGITVTLYNAAGTAIGNTVTDATGKYLFPGLANGTYSVGFSNLPNSFIFTTAETTPSATGSDANIATGKTPQVTLTGNTNNTTLDAGIYPQGNIKQTVSIGDKVFYDLNNNGIQDIGETGVSGVTATLLNAGPDGILGNSDDGASIATSTNGQGEYIFTGLPAGNYAVQFSNLPASYVASPANAGGNDTLDSDGGVIAAGKSTTPVYQVQAGEENLTIDLGLFKPGVNSIGNQVWIDVNKNGLQDNVSKEPGVAGVLVRLLNPDGSTYDKDPTTPGLQPYVVSTDNTGRYLFTNLPDGTYRVEFTSTPAGYTFTTQGNGSNPLTDSDPNALSGITNSVTVTGGQTNLTLDAGLITTTKAILGDKVWNDLNNDGIQDAGEPGIPGILVTVYDNAGVPITSTVTDADGSYLFTNLNPGTYSVGFSNLPKGTIFTTPNATNDSLDSDVDTLTGRTGPIVLAAGDVNLTVDAGVKTILKGAIGNYVWYDQNLDGLQSQGEPGIAGVTVTLKDAVSGAILATAVTDGNGYYIFSNLDQGVNKYTVTFGTLPQGYEFTKSLGPITDSFNSDANPITGVTAPITVIAGQLNSNIDAGLFISDTLGNYVWLDINKNGIQDPSEVGVAGVTVTLFDAASGAVKGTTQTDAFGKYEFINIGKGVYRIGVTLPVGYDFTTNTDPSGVNILGTANNSDVSLSTGLTQAFVFDAGTTNRNVDAGITPALAPVGLIGNFVWEDLNGDGLQSANEPGISGLTVSLLNNAGAVIGSTVTDANGLYQFTNLAAGTYKVKFSSPVSYLPTTKTGAINDSLNSDMDPNTFTTAAIVLAAGQINNNIDAGFVKQPASKASLGDLVYYDLNQDGIQDPNELGVPNVRVFLLDSNNNFVDTVFTDALGNYLFNNLDAGVYSVVFDIPSGYNFSAQAGTTDTTLDSDPDGTGQTNPINLNAGEKNMTVDAGIFKTAVVNSIGDKVWKDIDGDGLQDTLEAGITGALVTLYNNAGVAIATTTTDATGNYLFSGLPNGSYSVGFSNFPAGLQLTHQTTGTTNGSDADSLTGRTPLIAVSGGVNRTDIDAGLKPTPTNSGSASLGDKVWYDVNANGLQDANEAGVGGVKVYLYASNGISKLDSTITDGYGNYLFTALKPGSYVVGFVPSSLPLGATITTVNADGLGINGGKNSDANAVSGKTPVINIVQGDVKLTVDMGIVPAPNTASVGDKVWNDVNGDGLQGPNEPGISGISVTLYDANGIPVGSTATDANGEYHFVNLTPGNYSIGFGNLPASFTFTKQTTGTTNGSDADSTTGRTPVFNLTAGQVRTDIDAGVKTTTTASLGNYVWYDANANGIQDATETGVAGVLVTLYNNANTPIATAVTTATGWYNFINLQPGSYSVGFTNLPVGTKLTDKEAVPSATGSDVNTLTGKTDPIVLIAGEYNPNIDAGIKPIIYGSVGDKVWNDENKDGIQDPTEQGVPGVKVILKDATGAVVGIAITDGNGEYKFSNVPPGTGYTVEFTNLPFGYVFTPNNGVLGNPLNSDANTTTGKTVPFSVTDGQEITYVDAGIYLGEGNIGNYLWYDANKDGIQDTLADGTNELPVIGATVRLYNSLGNLVATTLSDSTGHYLFSNLTPGNYYVNLPSGTGLYLTKANIGNNLFDSDFDTTTRNTTIISLASGQTDTTWDAGFYKAPTLNIGDPCSCHDILFERNEIYEVLDKLEVTATPGGKWKILSQTGMKTIDTFINVYLPIGFPMTEDSAGHYSLLFAHEVGIGYTVTVTDGFNNLTYANTCDIRKLKTSVDSIYALCGLANPIPLSGQVTRNNIPVSGVVMFMVIKANGDTLFNQTALDPSIFNTGDSAQVIASFSPTSNLDCPMVYRYKVGITPGAACAASLGDYVWIDANKNGIQDSTENGVAGVTVNLINVATGKIVGATVTDAYGKYLFPVIAPGQYQVGFTLPSNYVFTQNTNVGGLNPIGTANNSDVDSTTGKTKTFTVNSGDSIRSVDAGIYFKAPTSTTLGNYVWDDANGNGLQDPTEAGIAGVTVTLFNNSGVPVATTVTDNAGNYLFKDLTPGTYTIGFTAPIGFIPTTATGVLNDPLNSDINTTGKTGTITLAAGDNNLNVDAGFIKQNNNLASLGDKVWYDINNDGIQDATEGGVANVTVELYNGAGTTLLKSTTTDAMGNYIFNALAPGTYKVKFIAPSGYTISPANATTDSTKDSNPNVTTGFSNTIGLAAGDKNMTIDAGIYNPTATNSIGDKVWFDNNSDGLQDATETGVQGVLVTLYNNLGNPIATTTTNSNGNYQFAGLPNGTYSVGFTNLPEGTLLTTQTINTATGSDADPATGKTPSVNLTGGTQITDLDAGLKPSNIPSGSASLGNKVWWDINNNGLQDANESGVPNVVVNLYNAAGTTILKTTTTDALGIYMFTGLNAGSYIVGFEPTSIPAGTNITAQNADAQGIGGAANSDANTTTGKTGTISLSTGEEKLTIDMGIVPKPNTGTVGDKVWLDANKDGLQGPTEIGIPGVMVKLYDSNGSVVGTTTTDINGNYQFVNVTPGAYTVGFSNLPTGYFFTTKTPNTTTGSDADSTTGLTNPFNVAASQNVTDIDAGIYSPTRAALGNYVWLDANLNGIQDANETGIPGVLVTLFNKTGKILATTVTDADGKYLFDNLTPGNYLVGFTNIPNGSLFTTRETLASSNGSDVYPSSGKTGVVILTAGQVNLDVDAGVIPAIAASVGDYVWIDANKNGLQDATEKGVPGVIVKLKDAVGDIVGEAITDGNGKYLFASVIPANAYTITFSNLPTAYKFTKSVGTLLDSTNSDADTNAANLGVTAAFNLASGQHLRTIDAGISKTLITLTGNVWHDVNANTDGFVNNSGALTTPPATVIPNTLYAYLVSPVTGKIVKRASVNGLTGVYNMGTIEPSTFYYIILSDIQAIVGNTVPAAHLPFGWANTGEKLGITSGNDGIVEGRLNVPGSVNNIINANFGIRLANGESVIP
jgi:protocatechuate 3,4-dioxygenase beta subunit